MMEKKTDIEKVFENCEQIGVIGSPSTTSELTIDILGTAAMKELVGNMAVFKFYQDGFPHYALGQITEILMQNVWTQDPTMRGIIRLKGRADPVTEKQDIHTAKMRISAVLKEDSEGVKPGFFGTVPPTGTEVKLINEELMSALFSEYNSYLWFLGRIYGTSVLMPMWLKHFGSEKDDPMAAGEAYHIGIFGKTGSGKSVLAKMMIAGYSQYDQMSIFILDPQGEFARDFSKGRPLYNLIKNEFGKDIEIYSLNEIVLSRFDGYGALYKKILSVSPFMDRLGVVASENRSRAAEEIYTILKKFYDNYKKGSTLHKFDGSDPEDVIFDYLILELKKDTHLNKIYTSQDPRERVKNQLENSKDELKEEWDRVDRLFSKKWRHRGYINLNDLVEKINNNNIIIIDMSETSIPEKLFWNEELQYLIISEILKKVSSEANKFYKNGELLNTLIVIDEAHRLAPRETPESENLSTLRNMLVDYARTTRKYGLGWMFISQTLSSLHKDIISQLRIYIFGFGLGWGSERLALRDIIGGAEDAIRLYQLFKDPQSSIGKREYSFMCTGPISPLSFSGTPLFFTALDFPEEFIKINTNS